jgi:hypothetical protein
LKDFLSNRDVHFVPYRNDSLYLSENNKLA